VYESLALERASTVERVAEALRRGLFAGDLGPGTPLREVALAESLGVARSTVREALQVLTGEGLLTRLPHRGVVVTTHDPDAVHDVVHARAVLEVAGVRGWPDASERDRQGVRDAVDSYESLAARSGTAESPTAQEVAEAHLAVHVALVGLTGSARLVGVAESLAAEIRLALAHVDRLRDDLPVQVANHRDLVERLEAGDVDGVATRLHTHLAGAENSIRVALTRLPGST